MMLAINAEGNIDGSYAPNGFGIWAAPLDGSASFDWSLPPIQKTQEVPTIKEFLGACSFYDTPINTDKISLNTRHYTNWGWFIPNGVWEDGDTRVADLSWDDLYYSFENYAIGNLDDDLQARFDAGIRTTLNLKDTDRVMKTAWKDGTTYESEYKPLDDGATDGEDPNSYRTWAHFCYNLAARYGSNTNVDTTTLSVDPNETVKVGLNLLGEIEIWNEQDKDWRGRMGFFRYKELAALMSIVIDSHNGTITDSQGRPVFGIKNADPNMKVYIGGMAGENPAYTYLMIKHMAKIRGQSFSHIVSLIDGFDYHMYSNNAGGQFGDRVCGVPGETDIESRQSASIDLRDRYILNTPFFIREFGYDEGFNPSTGSHSYQVAPKVINGDSQETQAAWIMRSAFEMARIGVNWVSQYMLRDVSGSGYLTYSRSGLFVYPGYDAKPSAWLWKAFLNNFGDHKFGTFDDSRPLYLRVIDTQNQVNTNEFGYIAYYAQPMNVMYDDQLAAFNDAANQTQDTLALVTGDVDVNQNGFYLRTADTAPVDFAAAWIPYNGRSGSLTLDIDTSITRARVIKWGVNAENGVSVQEPITANQITFEVSDTPVFVIGDNQPLSVPNTPTVFYISGSTTDSISLRWDDNNIWAEYIVIEHSTDGSTWSQLATVAIGTQVYTHTGLAEDSLNYYRIYATNTAGNSVPTSAVSCRTTKSGLSIVKTAQVDFRRTTTDDATYPPVTGWNNHYWTDKDTGISLNDTTGAATGWSVMTFEDAASSWGYAATYGAPSSAVWDVEVFRYIHTMYSDGATQTVSQLKFTGLDVAKEYKIELGLDRVWGNTDYWASVNIGNLYRLHNQKHNTNIVTFENVTPDASGEILITIERLPNPYGGGQFLNAAKIHELSASTGPQFTSGSFSTGYVPAPDTDPPVYTSGPTNSTPDANDDWVNTTETDEYAEDFLIVVDSGATAPTPAEIIAGVDYGGVTVHLASNTEGQIIKSHTHNITGLPQAAYDIYNVARDLVGNVQTSVSKTTVSTAPVTWTDIYISIAATWDSGNGTDENGLSYIKIDSNTYPQGSVIDAFDTSGTLIPGLQITVTDDGYTSATSAIDTSAVNDGGILTNAYLRWGRQLHNYGDATRWYYILDFATLPNGNYEVQFAVDPNSLGSTTDVECTANGVTQTITTTDNYTLNHTTITATVSDGTLNIQFYNATRTAACIVNAVRITKL